mmetsp:Transcript_41963/g.115774  ORF Transcript_41963/g.115774 Transcript_41963/m.115774 type:complete len:205 (-) Transcript_41963:485-1099(-)
MFISVPSLSPFIRARTFFVLSAAPFLAAASFASSSFSSAAVPPCLLFLTSFIQNCITSLCSPSSDSAFARASAPLMPPRRLSFNLISSTSASDISFSNLLLMDLSALDFRKNPCQAAYTELNNALRLLPAIMNNAPLPFDFEDSPRCSSCACTAKNCWFARSAHSAARSNLARRCSMSSIHESCKAWISATSLLALITACFKNC